MHDSNEFIDVSPADEPNDDPRADPPSRSAVIGRRQAGRSAEKVFSEFAADTGHVSLSSGRLAGAFQQTRGPVTDTTGRDDRRHGPVLDDRFRERDASSRSRLRRKQVQKVRGR